VKFFVPCDVLNVPVNEDETCSRWGRGGRVQAGIYLGVLWSSVPDLCKGCHLRVRWGQGRPFELRYCKGKLSPLPMSVALLLHEAFFSHAIF
jgi:hypothetical protein